MNSLADVELQLIMHGLEVRELLMCARCSHQLLHAADHPFAWRRHPPLLFSPDQLCKSRWVTLPQEVPVASPPPPPAFSWTELLAAGWSWLVDWRLIAFISSSPPSPSPLLQSQLQPQLPSPQPSRPLQPLPPPSPSVPRVLRHFRLTIRWPRCYGYGFLPDHLAALLSLSLPLLELDASEWHGTVGSKQWRRVLRAPAARYLRVLRLHGADGFDSSVVAQLPYLHTLSVERRVPLSSSWSSLPAAPSLTSLKVVDHDARDSRQSSCLQYVALCRKLIHLNLQSNALNGDGFSFFFADSPYMHLLQSLQLNSFECASVSAASYVAAFSALVRLHYLCLHSCSLSHRLLFHLVHAPVLRHLTLHPRSADLLSFTHQAESALVVAELLLASTHLSCTLSMQMQSESTPQQQAKLVVVKQRYESDAQLLSFGARFRVELSATASVC